MDCSSGYGEHIKAMSDSPPPLALHRCRFVDASPSPITALAFPALPLPSPTTKATGKQRERDRDRGPAFGTLVIGHANGNIDLLEWTGELGESQASQAWHRRKVSLLLRRDPNTQVDPRRSLDPTHQKSTPWH